MSVAPPAPLRQTPLHAEHVALGARMVDFGGWSMPVQYSGILEEHQAVRTAVGLFDISHMGQFFVRGAGAAAWLEEMLTNRVARLALGECQYTFLLNEQGGVIDDLIVYRLEEEEFLLVVNAGRIDENWQWLQAQLEGGRAGVQLANHSDAFAGLAVQGPRSVALFDALFGGRYTCPARNRILVLELDGARTYIARTGYTGEDGFEIFCPAERAVSTWRDLLQHGASLGLKPCGLGARDTLRLEMCYPLNGSDLSPLHTPLEAGLGFFVDLTKPAFRGREALLAQKEAGVQRRLVPFQMQGKAPPMRPHYLIYQGDTLLGETTSGTLSPSLGVGIGMAYLPAAQAWVGELIEIDIRGKRYPAQIVKKPLYQPPGPAPAGQAPVPA